MKKINIKLLMTRHGHTKEGELNILAGHQQGSLSEKGVEETKKFAKKISKIKFDVIFSSDLHRARQTALEIHKYHKKTPLKFTKLLRERNSGIYDGKRFDSPEMQEFRDNMKKFGRDYRPRGGGESSADVYKRIEKFYHKLIKYYNGKTVLIISHAATTRYLLAVLEGKENIDREMEIPNNVLLRYTIKQ